jgi:hypothetical protein
MTDGYVIDNPPICGGSDIGSKSRFVSGHDANAHHLIGCAVGGTATTPTVRYPGPRQVGPADIEAIGNVIRVNVR